MSAADLLKAASDLKEEASRLIRSSGLNDILASYGRVFYSGSYYLDLMVWPDLDIDISLHHDPYSVKSFFQLGSEVVQLREVKSMKFVNLLDSPDSQDIPPKGLYWKIQVARPGKAKPWKIDIWSFDEATLEKHEKHVKELASRIDDHKRKRIIELKHSLLTKEGRTPVFSGYHIYQAVLFQGIENGSDIIRYLRSNGVIIEE